MQSMYRFSSLSDQLDFVNKIPPPFLFDSLQVDPTRCVAWNVSPTKPLFLHGMVHPVCVPHRVFLVDFRGLNYWKWVKGKNIPCLCLPLYKRVRHFVVAFFSDTTHCYLSLKSFQIKMLFSKFVYGNSHTHCLGVFLYSWSKLFFQYMPSKQALHLFWWMSKPAQDVYMLQVAR